MAILDRKEEPLRIYRRFPNITPGVGGLVEPVVPEEPSHHDGGEVLALEAADGLVQGLVHGGGDPLGDEPVQVDGAAQQLQHGTESNKVRGTSSATRDELR